MSTQPPAPSMDWAVVVQDLARQPELFDSKQVPHLNAEDADLVRTSRGFRYSGKINSKNEGRCLLIAALVMSGRMSLRKISDTVKCDHRTVAAVMRHLEESGLLPTVETRVRRLLQETEEQVLLWIDELVASRVVDRDTSATIRSLFTGAGIAADKRMAADPLSSGNLTVQIGVQIGAGSEVQATWERRLAAALNVTPDTQSGVDSRIPAQIESARPSATPLDTQRPAVIEVGAIGLDPADHAPSTPAQGGAPAGGGVGPAGAGHRGDA